MLNKEDQSQNLLTFNQDKPSFLQNNHSMIEEDKTPVNFFQTNEIGFPSPVHHLVEDEYFSAPVNLLSNKDNSTPQNSLFAQKMRSQNDFKNSANSRHTIFEKSEIAKTHITPKRENSERYKNRTFLSSGNQTVSHNQCPLGATPVSSKKSSFQSTDPFQMKPSKQEKCQRNSENSSVTVIIIFFGLEETLLER